MIALFVVFAILQGLDLYTTNQGMQAGGKELNPVMKYLFDKFSPLSVLLVVKASLVAGIWAYLPSIHIGALVTLNLIYLVVVFRNFRVLRSMA